MSGTSPDRLHVVVANWRDGGHPDAGGAEVFAEQMAAALREHGCRVTFLAAARGSATTPTSEEFTGSDVERVLAGGRWTVYPRVAWWLLRHRRDVDAVVDCQNGIPFFAPVWVRRSTAVVCVVHHVHTEQFGLHFPAPVAAVGRLLEGPVASRVYGRRPAVAVSPSTARDLRRRLHWRGPIVVVPNGASPVAGPRDLTRRSQEPTVLSVARLVVHKRMNRLVDAAQRLAQAVPGVQVRIVGTGPDAADLATEVAAQQLSTTVQLTGWLPRATLRKEWDRAWVHVVTTAGEGWGLSVIEAAARGLPTVAFDVAGVRDSVRDGRTGWLLPDDADLAAGLTRALRELADSERAAQIATACQDWASEFSWSGSARRLIAVVEAEVQRRRAVARERRGVTDDSWVVQLRSGVDVSAWSATLRRTDRVGVWEGQPWLLLTCARSAVEQVMVRVGGSADDVVAIRPAGDEDLLRAVPLRTPVGAA